jgi:transcriptional regulator with XRE-family HTH domain
MDNPYSIHKTPQALLQSIADKHKKLRKKKGYTQSELADRSGVSLGSLKRFEQTGQISLENLLRLALVLDRLEDFEPIFELDTALEDVERLFSDKTRR